MGYLEAECLHKHFVDEGRDKDAWERRKVLFGPGGKRRLYGYLASKEDIELFNQHSYDADYLEKFYKEQTANVHEDVEETEKVFEKLLQEERIKAKEFELKSGSNDDSNLRKEAAGKFIERQVKGVEEFEAEREKLIRAHDEKKANNV